MANLNFFGRLQKVDGNLVHVKTKDTKEYELFKKAVPEGGYIDLYVEQVTDDGTIAQLKKVHSMIAEISHNTGFTLSETKILVKDKAGLCIMRNQDGRELCIVPSFADCGKEELGRAITACYEMGEKIGFPMM